ncbi:MAG TPA: phosphoribosylglycinamide synthetase C domain-containing protein, partial [Phenylobacterium sp.]|nr:phosphoribosylglycinamide synthetase C domain-containing protein [Phenylobacterium sp.]
NTGGMGTYAPAPLFTDELVEQVRARLAAPAFAAIAQEGSPYRGALFVEFMATAEGPKLVEFNVRFGDPECQVLMLRLESDLLPYLVACATGTLAGLPPPVWRDESAVCVVLAAEGYPDKPVTGAAITGADGPFGEGVQIFHAGTTRDAEGILRASGGRVLNVCARGNGLTEARERAYAALSQITLPGGFYRRDIGWRALARQD